MATQSNLMGVGVPGPQALRLGFVNNAVTGVGTSQTSGPVLAPMSVNTFSAASGQTAARLPSPAQGSAINDTIYVACITSDAAAIFPDSGSQIDLGTVDTGSVAVAQNKMRLFIRTSPTQWKTLYNS